MMWLLVTPPLESAVFTTVLKPIQWGVQTVLSGSVWFTAALFIVTEGVKIEMRLFDQCCAEILAGFPGMYPPVASVT